MFSVLYCQKLISFNLHCHQPYYMHPQLRIIVHSFLYREYLWFAKYLISAKFLLWAGDLLFQRSKSSLSAFVTPINIWSSCDFRAATKYCFAHNRGYTNIRRRSIIHRHCSVQLYNNCQIPNNIEKKEKEILKFFFQQNCILVRCGDQIWK